jgi:hypothetical protein
MFANLGQWECLGRRNFREGSEGMVVKIDVGIKRDKKTGPGMFTLARSGYRLL